MDIPVDWRQLAERVGRDFPWHVGLRAGCSGLGEPEPGAWEDLPLITASVLENHYYTAGNPLAGREDHRSYRTSGTSSGLRKTIYYSERDEAQYLRVKLEMFRELLEHHGWRTALSDMGTGHAEATAVEVFRQLGMQVESLSFRLPIQEHVEALLRLQPEVLYTMPSILDRIMAEAADPAALGIRHVLLVGEMASPGWRSQAARRLGIAEDQVSDTYGSIEIGTIASYSHRHGLYLLADGLYAEGIPAESLGLQPLAEGEQVLVLTSELREAFPALRYVTYDVVRGLRMVEIQGRRRQGFDALVKRIGPDLKHGEKISLYDIENAVYRQLGEARMIVLVEGNELTVAIDSRHGDEAALERVREELERSNPDIGAMIASGLLGGIRVIAQKLDEPLDSGPVKQKKIHYRPGGSQ